MEDVRIHRYSVAFTDDSANRVILDYGELSHLLRLVARRAKPEAETLADSLRVAARSVEILERQHALETV